MQRHRTLQPDGAVQGHDAVHDHDHHHHDQDHHRHDHARVIRPRRSAPPLSLIALSGWTRLALVLPAIALLWLLTLRVTNHG
ncbi:MAG: hypothetical protein ACK4YX_06660 [Rhabdaerophilum calidifontis]